jgi:hypothetical protein
MMLLSDILDDMADADSVAAELRRLAEAAPRDEVLRINLDAVARRRRDLERRMARLLGAQQLDLVQYRVGLFDGAPPPAATLARSLLLFQALVTSIFDAVRTVPKRRYAPSNENIRLSAFNLAAVPGDRGTMGLTILNDRLLLIESDLDIAFGLLFDLLQARAKTMLRQIAATAGIASVSAGHAWADHAAQHGLTTTIIWRKPDEARRSVTLSHSEALLLKTAIEAVADEAVEQIERDCELAAIDDGAGTFRVTTADGETIAGSLADSFPRGRGWMSRHWYVAVLTRATRIRYATGEETVRWQLRALVPHE